jgi:hypothetical protein
VVVGPIVGGDVGRARAVVFNAIDRPDDPVALPIDGEDVEVVGDRRRQVGRAAVAVGTRVARSVERPVQAIRLPAEVLHDVDLAAIRPADRADVGAQHPEGGPQPSTGRDLDPRLDPAVRQLESALRQESSGRVLARPVVALEAGFRRAGGDHEIAGTVGCRVGRVVRIELELVVAPAGDALLGAVAEGVPPVIGVRRRAGGLVELVAPDEGPARIRGGECGPGWTRQWRGRGGSIGAL